MKGLFVVLDGLGGAGKSSVRDKAQAFFEERGLKVIVTREPGGTPEAEILRKFCREGFGPGYDPLDPMAAALLFNTARADHVGKVIKPYVEKGYVVLCDRFCDTTFAYQSEFNGLDIKTLIGIHELAIGVYPDMTFLLDLPAEVAMNRVLPAEKLSDQFDRASCDTQERIRQAYLWLAKKDPERYDVIDATQAKDDVFQSMTPMLERLVRNLKINNTRRNVTDVMLPSASFEPCVEINPLPLASDALNRRGLDLQRGFCASVKVPPGL